MTNKRGGWQRQPGGWTGELGAKRERLCPLCKVCWQATAEGAGALGYTAWAKWASFLSAAVSDTVSSLAWRVTEPQGRDIQDASSFHLPPCVWAHACACNRCFSLALHPGLQLLSLVRLSYSSSRIGICSIAVAHLPLCSVLLQPVFWGLSALPAPLPAEAFSSANIANLSVSRVSFSPPYLHPSQTPGPMSAKHWHILIHSFLKLLVQKNER